MSSLPLVMIACAIIGLDMAWARTDECSGQIAQLEALLDQPMSKPTPKPMSPQSVDAQLHRQPTPETLRRAEQSAQSRLAAVLARAKILQAEGKTSECIRSVGEAKLILGIN